MSDPAPLKPIIPLPPMPWDRSPREQRVRAVLLWGAIAVLVIATGRFLFVHPLRRALPWSARDVQAVQWIEPGPLSQDYAYFLRARLDRGAFEGYVAWLGLERTSGEVGAFTSGPDEHHGGTIAGWRGPEGELYGRQDRAGWCWVWYAEGHVHVTTGEP